MIDPKWASEHIKPVFKKSEKQILFFLNSRPARACPTRKPLGVARNAKMCVKGTMPPSNILEKSRVPLPKILDSSYAVRGYVYSNQITYCARDIFSWPLIPGRLAVEISVDRIKCLASLLYSHNH